MACHEMCHSFASDSLSREVRILVSCGTEDSVIKSDRFAMSIVVEFGLAATDEIFHTDFRWARNSAGVDRGC